MRRHSHAGFTLVEMMLFTGILALLSGTLVATYIATQDARIRQQYLSEVEQYGVLLLSQVTSAIRNAEAVLLPAANSDGTILALQMRSNAQEPTIYLATASGDLLEMERDSARSLLDNRLTIENFAVRNIGGTTVIVSYDLHTVIRTHPPVPYSRHFQATTTRFPDDHLEAGGCGSCPVPACTAGTLTWHVCDEDTCTPAELTLPCEE